MADRRIQPMTLDPPTADAFLEMDRRRFMTLCATAGGALVLSRLPGVVAPVVPKSGAALRGEISGRVRLVRKRRGKGRQARLRGWTRRRRIV